MQHPFHQTRTTLAQLKLKLEEDERRRQRELVNFQELKKSIMRIYESDQEHGVMPDLVRADTMPKGVTRKVETAEEALRELKEGNLKFLANEANSMFDSGRKMELHLGQKPHAIIVTCSDSRVPPELIFSQGFGDLFVIRLAGNTVDALARASILYAIQHLGAPLVVVMGHQNCGAVKAALCPDEALVNEPGDIKTLVAHIKEGLRETVQLGNDDEKVLCAVVTNVRHVVKGLQGHPDVAWLVRTQGIKVVGAYYGFNGGVTFFDERSSPDQIAYEQRY